MSHEHVGAAINWWAWDPHRSPMGWFLLDFAVFVALLVYFTARPLRQALQDRHHNVRRAVAQAAASHGKATAEQKLWADKLAALDHELSQLEDASRADGEAEVARMVADAEARATQMRADAKAQAEQELRRAHETVRQQVLQEVLQEAQRLSQEAITENDQKELMAHAVSSLPELPHKARRQAHTMGAHP